MEALLPNIGSQKSLQNVAVKRLTENWDATAISSIIRLGHDAPLSGVGEAQVTAANEFLRANEWSPKPGAPKPQLIVHSPHIRSKQTASGLFNGCTIPIFELHCLYERTVWEYAYITPMDMRIAQTNEWLRERPEEVIVIVGHGQYFRRWLGLGYTQSNVHVMECSWSVDRGISLLHTESLQLK